MEHVAGMRGKKNACRNLVRKPDYGDLLEDLGVGRGN
jgi:uncharacterized protein YjiS (DUF1127 family)